MVRLTVAQTDLLRRGEFIGWNMKPLTLRFDVVNVVDTLDQIRSGTGIGVFAPQYGPRQGFFAGLSQKF